MKIIELNEFIQNENKNGIFVFTYGDKCDLCKIQKITLKERYFYDFVEVNLKIKDEYDWFMNTFMTKGIPFTIVYKNNIPIYEKSSVFFQKQIMDMAKIIKYHDLGV